MPASWTINGQLFASRTGPGPRTACGPRRTRCSRAIARWRSRHGCAMSACLEQPCPPTSRSERPHPRPLSYRYV